MSALRALLLLMGIAVHRLVAADLGRSALPEVDGDILGILQAITYSGLHEDERGRLRERLFALPKWDQRLGQVMAELAVRARYDGKYDRLSAEYDAVFIDPKFPEAGVAKKREIDAMIMHESVVKNEAEAARGTLFRILVNLSAVRDVRVIPLIAPLLSEKTIATTSNGLYGLVPTQSRAASSLDVLRIFSPVPNDPPTGATISGWQEWWERNRKGLPPVPDALARLEGVSPDSGASSSSRTNTTSIARPLEPSGRDGQPHQPSPSAPVSTTPVPKRELHPSRYGVVFVFTAVTLLVLLLATRATRKQN